MSSVPTPRVQATSVGDPYFNGQIARQRIDQLHADAQLRRLIKEHRQLHPRHGPRIRVANVLRRVADRLATAPPAGRTEPVGARRPALSLPMHGR
ncbi:MAG TPA: hypothetical protein VIP98_24330 [Microlunatus sp.]